MTRSTAFFWNSAAASWLIAWRGALAHADQNIALADRHHIAAFEGGEPMVRGRITPPDIDLADEVGVEFVDRGHQDRLLVPRRPIERIDGDAAIDPARRVTRVDRVRQWRQ